MAETVSTAADCLTAAGLAGDERARLAAAAAGPHHRIFRRPHPLRGLLAQVGAPAGAAAAEGRDRKGARAGGRRADPGRRAGRARAFPAPACRRGLRCAHGQAVTLRAGRGAGDAGGQRGAGAGADRAGDRRRGGMPAARQGRPRDRPGALSLRRARQRARRTPSLPCHAAAAAGGAGAAAASSSATAWSSSTAPRCAGTARPRW